MICTETLTVTHLSTPTLDQESIAHMGDMQISIDRGFINTEAERDSVRKLVLEIGKIGGSNPSPS